MERPQACFSLTLPRCHLCASACMQDPLSRPKETSLTRLRSMALGCSSRFYLREGSQRSSRPAGSTPGNSAWS